MIDPFITVNIDRMIDYLSSDGSKVKMVLLGKVNGDNMYKFTWSYKLPPHFSLQREWWFSEEELKNYPGYIKRDVDEVKE